MEDITCQLNDESGKLMKTFDVDLSSGNNIISIDGNNLESGIYFIKFHSTGYNLSHKILLIK